MSELRLTVREIQATLRAANERIRKLESELAFIKTGERLHGTCHDHIARLEDEVERLRWALAERTAQLAALEFKGGGRESGVAPGPRDQKRTATASAAANPAALPDFGGDPLELARRAHKPVRARRRGAARP